MKLPITFLLATAVIGACPPLYAQSPATLVMDKSTIRFVSKQMNVPVEGKFRKYTANISFNALKPEATKAEFAVDLGSIDMGSPEAEDEVKRKVWFNTDVFPQAKFTAASVKALDGERFEVSGPLVIKGITHNIVATASVKTDAGGVTTAEGKFPLKRLHFNIGENQWADTDTVADEVEVRFKFVFSSKK